MGNCCDGGNDEAKPAEGESVKTVNPAAEEPAAGSKAHPASMVGSKASGSKMGSTDDPGPSHLGSKSPSAEAPTTKKSSMTPMSKDSKKTGIKDEVSTPTHNQAFAADRGQPQSGQFHTGSSSLSSSDLGARVVERQLASQTGSVTAKGGHQRGAGRGMGVQPAQRQGKKRELYTAVPTGNQDEPTKLHVYTKSKRPQQW